MTKKEAKLHPEQIDIVDFTILTGEIHNPEVFDISHIVKHDFSVDLNLSFNLEEKLIKSTILIEVQTDSEDKNGEEAKSKFKLVFLYHYDQLQDLAILDEDGKIALHPHLGNAISSITYSTSRGILMTRYQGTPFRDFILPVLNPNDLLD
ncbi:MAG: hypothetical protein ABJ004_06320 [Cyclobacteriaceae bacterium]